MDANHRPIIIFADGRRLEAPARRELANALRLQTAPAGNSYDVAIIGGGPAGLAAAVYGGSEGLRTIMIEREAPGGQAGTSTRIENYLGFAGGISGSELAGRGLHRRNALAPKSWWRAPSSRSLRIFEVMSSNSTGVTTS